MARNEKTLTLWRLLAGLCVATVYGMSCTPEQIALVADGVAAVAALEDDEDNISFGDWLASELEDL